MSKKNILRLWGYEWECAMEGHRIIHPDYPCVFYDKEKISQEKDVVRLTLGEPSQSSVEYWDGAVYYPQYGGGLIRSVDTFSYGYFSAEIMMPKGKGLWPSFWLCGEGSWPLHGEIDICEGYSDNHYLRIFTPYFPWLNPSWKTTTNVHYQEDNKHKQIGARSISAFKFYNPADNFIRYECEWTPDVIRIFMDGKLVRVDTEAVQIFSPLKFNDRVLYRMVRNNDDAVKKHLRNISRMRVIFNLLCEDPKTHRISMNAPMLIRNFKYYPL